MQYFLVLLVLILVVVLFVRYQEQKRKRQLEELERLRQEEEERQRKEEERRQNARLLYQNILPKVEIALKEFGSHFSLAEGYLTKYHLSCLQNRHRSLFQTIQNQPYNDIGLREEDVKSLSKFEKCYTVGEAARNTRNQKFIERELASFSTFFDNVEGRKLDLQQRTAIITDEDNNLIIAGAGSGKTTTIVGKVNYVLQKYRVQPEEILLISFTKKSATTLAQRINVEGVEAKTFHKFGMDIITEVEDRKPSIFDEAQFRPLLTRYFHELLANDQYLGKVTQFFTDFLKPVKSQHEFENHGLYIQYLKDQNFSTYKAKQVPFRGRTTYKREVVKSIEECKIANFLLFNGLTYEYEYPYEHDTATRDHRQYKPDFTVTQGGKKIYIEHSAVSRTGDVPPFFAHEGETYEQAKERYQQKMQWAREVHGENGTTLIETYSYEMAEGILFENLTEKLTAAGVGLHPMTPEQIWEIIQRVAEDEVKSFVTLFETFITLMKSNSYSFEDVKEKNENVDDSSQKRRNRLFLEILEPIFSKYQTHLRDRGEIDFSDMINKAASYVSRGAYNRKFRYVIIDEFQDISIGRYQLIKAIKAANPAARLFCVGDDWQSIYRFTGSDIALFKEFEAYFGHTVKSKIETTYRFHSPLIELSSAFILKNPNQQSKELQSYDPLRVTNYKIVYSVSENNDDSLALKDIFDELIRTKVDIAEKEILLLGRYSFDLGRISSEMARFSVDREGAVITYRGTREDGSVTTIKANFLTVHKSKGLEADIVIILNCNAGKHGFPSGMADDTVLNLLLSKADQFENGEERRLFYVAMTRAKEDVFFIANSAYKSKFIAELELNQVTQAPKKCPYCLTADLVLRRGQTNGRPWAFHGCANFQYGCEYKEWVNTAEL